MLSTQLRLNLSGGSGAYTLASSHPGLVRFVGPMACLRLAISILHAGCMLINRLTPNPGSGMQIKKIPPFSALVFWQGQVVSRMKKEGLSSVLGKRKSTIHLDTTKISYPSVSRSI